MPTRRDFLHTSTGSLGALCFMPSAFFLSRSQSSPELPLALFFGTDELQRMRSIFESDSSFDSLKARLESLDRIQMRNFIRDDVRYNDQLYDIVRLSDAAQGMAFYFALTGDADAAALSAECIRSIMKFDRWDYFLEAGQLVVGIQRASSTVIAISACADWLGTTIDDAERSSWLTTMRKKGNEACFRSVYGMRYPDTVVGWTRDPASTYFEHRPWDRPTDLSQRHIILDSTNLKAVPAAALAIGAMADRIHFGETEDSNRWIEQAIFSLRTFKDFFLRDGSYHEGVSYANYTALNILKATSVLRRHNVEDLTDIINWAGFTEYNVGMSMPTASDPYDVVNFGDNGNSKTGEAGRPKRTAVSMWVGANLSDPLAQWFGLNLGGEHDEWALVWYDPAATARAPEQGNQLWKCDLDWIVARTGFQSDDLTVAMRSGGPGNHEHADRNSIIVKDYGEQLVADPYRPPYGFKDPSWMMRTTAGHSALLIDGEGHQYHDGTEGTNASDARAQLVRNVFRDSYCYWTSDGTPAYQLVNSDVEFVGRSVFVSYDHHTIVIFDKVIKKNDPSVVQARFFGYNHDGKCRIEAKANEFTTARPLATLQGHSFGNNGVLCSTKHLPIPEEVAVIHPFAECATQSPALTSELVTVLTTNRVSDAAPTIRISESGGIYECQVNRISGSTKLLIHNTGQIPEFELIHNS